MGRTEYRKPCQNFRLATPSLRPVFPDQMFDLIRIDDFAVESAQLIPILAVRISGQEYLPLTTLIMLAACSSTMIS